MVGLGHDELTGCLEQVNSAELYQVRCGYVITSDGWGREKLIKYEVGFEKRADF